MIESYSELEDWKNPEKKINAHKKSEYMIIPQGIIAYLE